VYLLNKFCNIILRWVGRSFVVGSPYKTMWTCLPFISKWFSEIRKKGVILHQTGESLKLYGVIVLYSKRNLDGILFVLIKDNFRTQLSYGILRLIQSGSKLQIQSESKIYLGLFCLKWFSKILKLSCNNHSNCRRIYR